MLQNDYRSTPFRIFTICEADHVTFTSVILKYTKFSLPPHIHPPKEKHTNKKENKQKRKTENSCTIIIYDTLNKICNVKKRVAAVQNVKENLPLELILFLSSNSSIPTKSSLLQQPERTYTASLLFAKLNVKTEEKKRKKRKKERKKKRRRRKNNEKKKKKKKKKKEEEEKTTKKRKKKKKTANSIPYYAIQHEILTSSLPTHVCIRSEHRFALLLKSC